MHRLLLIIAHPEAINQHTRFVQSNMNRLFKELNETKNALTTQISTLQGKLKSLQDNLSKDDANISNLTKNNNISFFFL